MYSFRELPPAMPKWFYGVIGKGVFRNWEECNKHVIGTNAVYRKFKTEEEAKAFAENGMLGRPQGVVQDIRRAEKKLVTREELLKRTSLFLDLKGVIGKWEENDAGGIIGQFVSGILCVRHVGKAVYEIRLDEEREKVIKENGTVVVRGHEVQVLLENPNTIKTSIVKVQGLPFSAGMGELMDLVKERGWTLIGVPTEGHTVVGDRLCLNGDVYLRIRLENDNMQFPAELKLGEAILKLSGQRVQKTCFKCNSPDHLLGECPKSLCFVCRKPGHIARDCAGKDQEEDDVVMEARSGSDSSVVEEEVHGNKENEEQEKSEAALNLGIVDPNISCVSVDPNISCVSVERSRPRIVQRRTRSSGADVSPTREFRSPLTDQAVTKNGESRVLPRRLQAQR